MGDDKLFEIYSLSCPITGSVRYVGKANDSQKRLKSHLSDSKRRNTPVYQWINKLQSDGLKPIVSVITRTDNWQSEEIRIIQQYKDLGYDLLNVAIGGNEPACSLKTRQDNGRKNAKTIHSSPIKRRMWELKRALGSSISFLRKHNRIEKADEIVNRLAKSGIAI